MKTIRYLAGFLILLNGILHIYLYFTAPENTGVLVFGVLYSITGLLLFNSKKYPLYLGIFIPIIGMTLSFIKFGIPELLSMLALFKLLGIAAVVCCCIILLNKGHK